MLKFELSLDEANMILAGGTESMSGSGFVMPGQVRGGHKMMDLKAVDHMVFDGLNCGSTITEKIQTEIGHCLAVLIIFSQLLLGHILWNAKEKDS